MTWPLTRCFRRWAHPAAHQQRLIGTFLRKLPKLTSHSHGQLSQSDADPKHLQLSRFHATRRHETYPYQVRYQDAPASLKRLPRAIFELETRPLQRLYNWRTHIDERSLRVAKVRVGAAPKRNRWYLTGSRHHIEQSLLHQFQDHAPLGLPLRNMKFRLEHQEGIWSVGGADLPELLV